MFPDSLAKQLKIFDFFFLNTSVSCLKASLYCEAPMPPFLWTHSLHPGTLPSHCSISIPVLCSSSHALLQPSHHIYEISSKTRILSCTGGSFQLHCKFTRLRADTAQRLNTAVPGNARYSPPSLLPLQKQIGKNEWMNEWMITNYWHKVNASRFAQLVLSLSFWQIQKCLGRNSWEFCCSWLGHLFSGTITNTAGVVLLLLLSLFYV